MEGFESGQNPISETAWALIAYSTVPYLGILFIPFAFVAGGIGMWSGKKAVFLGPIAAAFGMLVIQLFLWWLLYFVPTIHNWKPL